MAFHEQTGVARTTRGSKPPVFDSASAIPED
jgi:hypothetical protein